MNSIYSGGKSILVTLLLLFYIFSAEGQNKNIIKYYDSVWMPVPQEIAVYYTEFEKINKHYSCTSYYAGSKKLKSTAVFTDTLFTKQIGLLKRYYESGVLEDSVLAAANSNNIETYHYYPNGKLWCYGMYNTKDKSYISKGFSDNGNEIPGFVTEREAAYPGGSEDWMEYLSKWIDTNIPVYKKAPRGVYEVVVKFIVDKNGKVINVAPETNFGFGMEEEVVRTIKRSKKWIPAIQYNLPVLAYRRQPISFVVR
jgi:hypothetical protein